MKLHNEKLLSSGINRARSWGLVAKEGQGGRRETGEEKGFPSYCPPTPAGTAAGTTVSL